MRKRKWIQAAHLRKGTLHRALGLPLGQKIPLLTLKSAAKRHDHVGRKARLALTLRKLGKK